MIRTLAFSLAIILVPGTTVLASETVADISNSETGADSTNSNDVTVTTAQDTTVTNTADVTNTVNFTVNTGSNTVSNNTEVEDVTTGDIDFTVEAMTVANDADNAAVFAPNQSNTLTITSQNSNTGANSTNANTQSITNTSSHSVTNTSTITNEATGTADTGNNTITNNTKVGDVTTGSVDINIRFNSFANSQPPTINGGGGPVIPTPPGMGGGGPVILPTSVTPTAVTPTTTTTTTFGSIPFTSVASASSPDTTVTPVIALPQGGFFAAGNSLAALPLLLITFILSALGSACFFGRLKRFGHRPPRFEWPLNFGSNPRTASHAAVRIITNRMHSI